jgi:hypothetical protein
VRDGANALAPVQVVVDERHLHRGDPDAHGKMRNCETQVRDG